MVQVCHDATNGVLCRACIENGELGMAPREQHFEEMKMGTRSREAAKLLIIGMVRQISGCGFPIRRRWRGVSVLS